MKEKLEKNTENRKSYNDKLLKQTNTLGTGICENEAKLFWSVFDEEVEPNADDC